MAENRRNKEREVRYEAVIFDMGGVFLPDPFQKFKDFEALMDLAPGIVYTVLQPGWVDGPWGDLVSGKMAIPEFARVFCQMLAKETNQTVPVDAVGTFMSTYDNALVYPEMQAAAANVRRHGLRTALLTNTAFLDTEKTQTLVPLDKSMFDLVVESCVLGYGKPDPRTYTECLHRLQLSADQVIFLDDDTENVRAAQALGITAIKVTSPFQAVTELSQVLGLPPDLVSPAPDLLPAAVRSSIGQGEVDTFMTSLGVVDTSASVQP